MQPKRDWVLFRADETAEVAGTQGVTRKFFTGVETGSHDLSTGVTRFEPDTGLFWHLHTVGESITILEGEPICEIGGAGRPAESIRMGPTDTIFIPAYTPHRFINPTGQPVRILWSYPTGRIERYRVNADGSRPDDLAPDEPQVPGAQLGRSATISLREVTGETVRAICKLTAHPNQNQFVAPNAHSFAQAYFEPKAWFRAIYADETPVGFVMLHDDAEKQEYFLWRFMIAEEHQGKGYGWRALQLLVDHVKTRPGAKALGVSYVPAEGGPGPFYQKFGFVETGEVDDGENVARLVF